MQFMVVAYDGEDENALNRKNGCPRSASEGCKRNV